MVLILASPKGPLIIDVTQFWNFFDTPPPLSCPYTLGLLPNITFWPTPTTFLHDVIYNWVLRCSTARGLVLGSSLQVPLRLRLIIHVYYQSLKMERSLVKLSVVVESVTNMSRSLRTTKVAIFLAWDQKGFSKKMENMGLCLFMNGP